MFSNFLDEKPPIRVPALGGIGPDDRQHVEVKIGTVVEKGLDFADDGQLGAGVACPPCRVSQDRLKAGIRVARASHLLSIIRIGIGIRIRS